MNATLEPPTFTLTSEPDHPSLSAKVPKGWKADVFTDELSGKRYKRAIDPDGFRWYWTGGQWILNVPWFSRTAYCKPDQNDDLAGCEHVEDTRWCPISPKGTIHLTPCRFVGPRHWNH